ncbi:phosphopantetheine-binding protein, partial [Staphylococcus aureus]|uniref:phosphopantetheine-binding protein n=1 Tax=Staphylococcus aureus TaxID=1280 RepID=UPI0034D954EA
PVLDGSDEANPVPQSAREADVASAWREVLRVERVGPDDNFFDCGGTSLLLARLHARLEQLVPGCFTIVDLFSLPTVRAQAARLRGEVDAVA